MNPPDVSRLAPLYGLGPWTTLIPLRPGTESRLWRFSAAGGSYVLRTLPSREQGETQYRLSLHLTSLGCSVPSILPALDGSPCVLQDGQWYHLQTFCPGRQPDPVTLGDTARATAAVLSLSAALGACPPLAALPAPDLAQLWAENRPFWDEATLPMPLSLADEQIAALRDVPSGPTQLIHGDLGPWNLLLRGKTVLILDFGAARMGDPLFDLAALLGGLLNHAPDHLRPQVLSEFFSVAGAVDRPRLLAQLRLWVWQNVAAWLPRGTYVPRLLSTLRFLESDPSFVPSPV